MRDQSPQPSGFVFPTALQPAVYEEDEILAPSEAWGWLEVFVLVQVLWGLLLFMPGSQAYRTYIRAFPYVTSLVALAGSLRSGGTESRVPGAPWILAALSLLVFNLVHPSTWIASGTAQIVFQAAIAAPVFWAARVWITSDRLQRLLGLFFAANFLSAALGLLQVYYPDTFLPPEFSSMALKLNPEFVSSLSYVGSGDRLIVRPPGLSDLPGGAAIAGTTAALLAFGFAMRPDQSQWRRLGYLGSAVIGITVVYLTQVRSMLLMLVACMMVVALVRLRQGRAIQSGWIAASAGALVAGSFVWAVTVGGDTVDERFRGIVDSGVVETYQESRGFFLDYTIRELSFEYPFGAGLGRWGMMAAYFGEPGNWQFPGLYAELQMTGWLYDGGVLMWLLYIGAITVAIRYSYRVAIDSGSALCDLAAMVLSVQLLVVGLCFTGPVFNTQVGIVFWLLTAVLYGSRRTLTKQEDLQLEAEAAEGEAESASES